MKQVSKRGEEVASEGFIARSVEVRTWPQQTDLLVIDMTRVLLLAHYPSKTEGEDLYDPLAPYEVRAELAIKVLEEDQDYLKACFGVSSSQTARLRLDLSARDVLDAVLKDYKLDLSSVELTQRKEIMTYLEKAPLDQLFALLLDWYDVAERHYPQGSSRLRPESWAVRSAPPHPYQFHYLAKGIVNTQDVKDEDHDEAFDLFESLINVALSEFSLGHLLRWAYFSRAEFPEKENFPLKALRELER